MDRLVKPDVKEVEICFKGGQKSTARFRISNLMHTMSVAVSLTTTNPSFFSFSQPFSIIPPLSSSSFALLLLSPPSDHDQTDKPPLSTPPDTITVRSTMLLIGKAHHEDLRRLFSRPGPHIFKDAVIPISLVGFQVAEYLILNHSRIPEVQSYFNKALCGCTGSQLTSLLKSAAVSCNNADLVSSLIDVGADANCKGSNGRSLITLAAKAGNLDVVKVLIASGGALENPVVDQVLLHEAAALNRVDLMKFLSRIRGSVDINQVDSCGRTPIHVAASKGHVEVIRFCVSVGGKTDVFDRNKWSPLHFAAAEGHLEAVRCLLDCSDICVKYAVNREGKTAYAIAAENGYSELYDLLHLEDALQRAARLDDVNGIKSCLAEGSKINGRDQNGWTPLHRAAFKGRVESVKVLLNHGAQVDVVDEAGYTPLHCAAEAGHAKVALLLIAHGAKASVKSLKGVVPLNLHCFKSNHPSIVKPLCQEKESL